MSQLSNIFVIDDSVTVIKTVEKHLKELEAKIHTFTDAKSALAELSNIQPDLILLDYFMPEMNGAEFMIKVSEKLLNNHNWEVFLISSHGFTDEELFSMQTLGITKIFKKPVPKDELLLAIDEFKKH